MSPVNNPMMSPHPGASPYGRHGWPDEPMKPPGTPGTPDAGVFSPKAGGVNSPDPYIFTSDSGSDQFSPSGMRPGAPRPPQHRLPGLQSFGISSPQQEEPPMYSPGMSPRIRPNTDPFAVPPPGSGPPEMMIPSQPRRASGKLHEKKNFV